MLILSTFNSDYLQKPLQYLLKEIDNEILDINYVETNLKVALFELQLREKKPTFCTILLTLTDLVINANKSVNEQLYENLNIILGQLIELNKEKAMSLIVFLCPCVNDFFPNEELKVYENKIYELMKEKEIHLITYKNIEQEYNLKNFKNILGLEHHIPFTPEFYIAIATLIAKKVHTLTPKIYKLIVSDLDNTLWSGILGEDGYENIRLEEHNLALQKFLVDQKKQGKIIALCSKNTPDNIDNIYKVFDENKRMLLKKDHLIVGGNKVNLNLKSFNIEEMSSLLNITSDQIFFIDDNEDEIREVKSKLPAVLCEKAPKNMEEFNESLLFRTNEYLPITDTDRNRTEFYKKQTIVLSKPYCFNDFLDELELYKKNSEIVKITVEQKKEVERISELTNRTNQFNLFRSPKNEQQIKDILTDGKNIGFLFREKQHDPDSKPEVGLGGALCSVEDNYLLVTDFFISCRAFTKKMGIEYILIKYIGEYAENNNLETVKIKFKKTDKNIIAVNFLNILIENVPCKKEILDKNFSDEMEIEFFSTKLKNLIVNNLTILTNKFNQLKSIELPEISKDVIEKNQKYYQSTIRLQEDTKSIEILTNKFFFSTDRLKSIQSLDLRVSIICNNLLGHENQNKSLVARGLDSLKATQLRLYLSESENVNVTIVKLLCEKTTVFCLIKYIKELEKFPEMHIQKNNIYNKFLPISFQQQRIWLAEQQESASNSANFHMLACYKVKQLDIQRFELACKKLIQLYDVFGTSFHLDDCEFRQSILEPEKRQLNFHVKNLKLGETIEEAIQLEISRPWTMQSKAPLIRFVIFEATQNYYIFFHVHHAIFDAVSLTNCLGTLSKIYQNTLPSNSSKPIDYPPQYIDFIHHQQKKLQNETYQTEAFKFWQKELSKIETVTILPTDQFLSTFQPVHEQAAKRYTFSLSSEDFLSLKALAKSASVTCFSVVNAVFGLLIASYTYQKNISLITVTNGRSEHPSFDKMVGFFVNLLVQQFDLEKNQNFIDYLKQVNKKFLASQAFQDIPFNKIQEILNAQGVKNILLSPAIIYQSYVIPELRIDNEIAELELPKQPIIFDMRNACHFGFTLFVQGRNFVIEANLLSASFEAFAKNLVHTIKNVCNNPKQKLQDISVVCDEERNELISLGQGPELEYAEDDSLVNRFKRSVEKYPDNNALCYGGIRLSYKEVDQQSTNLAHALIKAGIKPGDYVGIYLESNHLFFIAELAILKVGGVFIPLSIKRSAKQLKSIIDDAKINYSIIEKGKESLFDKDLATLIYIDSAKDVSVNNLPQLVKTKEDRFCILYTSGSTGNPKGVILLEKGIWRVVESPNFVKIFPESKLAQTADQAFDAAQLECWLAWNNGACLIVINKETILDPYLLQNKIAEEKITHMWLTAGLFNVYAGKIPDLFNKLKYLVVGGDHVHKEKVQRILEFSESPIIINGYGPAETSIFALTYTFDKQTLADFETSPIGLPINNTRIQILTPFGSLAPLSAIGQLCIAGDGVSEGYLNLSDLNKEKFIDNVEQKCYVSGDLVKIINGQIVSKGREINNEIKVSGYLVNLEGIRTCLSKHKLIQDIEVIPILKSEMDDKNVIHGINEIVNVVVFYTLKKSDREENTSSIHQELVTYLSENLTYGTVSDFFKVENFPMIINGKLDKKKLIDDYKNSMRNINKIPENVTECEKKVLEILREILPNFPNSKTNFLAWGVNSLQMVEFSIKLNDRFKESVFYPKDLYANLTVALVVTNLIKNPKNNIKTLRSLKEGNDDLPTIVFIHPAGGGLSYYDKLIQHVTFENTCYGIEDPLLDSNPLKLLSMEQMAQNYLSIISKEVQGSFILAGYSFGGMLALEMACQYEKTSENKFLLEVVLFDTREVSSAPLEIQSELKKKVLIHCANQREKMNKDKNLSHLMPDLEKLCEHHQEIGFKYVIDKTVKVSILFIGAKNLNDTLFNKIPAKEDHIRIFEAEASHNDMLENPHENGVADNFSKHIEKTNISIVDKKISIFSNKSSLIFSKQQPLIEIEHRQDLSEIAEMNSKRLFRN